MAVDLKKIVFSVWASKIMAVDGNNTIIKNCQQMFFLYALDSTEKLDKKIVTLLFLCNKNRDFACSL